MTIKDCENTIDTLQRLIRNKKYMRECVVPALEQLWIEHNRLTIKQKEREMNNDFERTHFDAFYDYRKDAIGAETRPKRPGVPIKEKKSGGKRNAIVSKDFRYGKKKYAGQES